MASDARVPTPTAAAFPHTEWHADGDTVITIIFGTLAVVLAGIQVLLSWQARQARI